MSLRNRIRLIAARHGQAPAIRFDGKTISYTDLDRRSNQFAHALAAANVGPGDRVGVWLHKSVDAIAAMQGALRVGAAYVPLDPKSPSSRIYGIVEHCKLACVVSNQPPKTGPDTFFCPYLRPVDADVQPTTEILLGDPQPNDLAYILYTSGSTGAPKGVCISQLNAAAFIDWAVSALDFQSTDRLSNHAPFHFDLSVLDLYGAFTVGACVCLVPPNTAYAPTKLVEFLVHEKISVWYSVPSVLIMMLDRADLATVPTPHLRTLLFAGEPFPIKHLRRLAQSRPEVRLLNLYGPTETNVCTFHEVQSSNLERAIPVPIGQGCSGDQVWARDADGAEVEDGQRGELIVSGDTVMLGYWGEARQEGPYATGDLVWKNTDGDYEYAGRLDHMVKIRGFRVELGDVEAALLDHPQLLGACVVASGEGLERKLVAFLVAQGENKPGLLSLKRHCAARLPKYMIVDTVFFRDEFPLTRTGKVDRRSLLISILAQRVKS